jgi:hypothetical protein
MEKKGMRCKILRLKDATNLHDAGLDRDGHVLAGSEAS